MSCVEYVEYKHQVFSRSASNMFNISNICNVISLIYHTSNIIYLIYLMSNIKYLHHTSKKSDIKRQISSRSSRQFGLCKTHI